MVAGLTDLADFGYREREMAEELLKAWREQGLPEDFYDHEVTIMMNPSSGYVFLTNEGYQVAMINWETEEKGTLESFYSCPECGGEGFYDDLKEEGDDCCREYLREIRGEEEEDEDEGE